VDPITLIFVLILSLIVNYVVIRLAVTHALKTHSRWAADGSLDRELERASKLKADRDYVASFQKPAQDR